MKYCLFNNFFFILDILHPTEQYINEANLLLQPGRILVYICYYVSVEQGYLHPYTT